jgi:hypothetical protein
VPTLPVDELISRVQDALPGAKCERLTVTHAADDDNIWWIWIGPGPREVGVRSVQIDTAPEGQPPFFLEGDDEGQRLSTDDTAEAAAVVIRWL